MCADRDPELRSSLLQLQDSLVTRTISGFRPLVESYGLEPRPPLSWDQFGFIWLLFVEGQVLRAGIQGEDYDSDVLVAAAMAMFSGLTRRAGEDDRDLETAYAEHFGD